MLFVRSFVRSCHGSAGREAARTARPTVHDRPRTTTHDRPRTTTRTRPRTTTHDRPCTTAHDQPQLPYLFTHPTPGGFRGLNCLARLALARERTPSCSKTNLVYSASQPNCSKTVQVYSASQPNCTYLSKHYRIFSLAGKISNEHVVLQKKSTAT